MGGGRGEYFRHDRKTLRRLCILLDRMCGGLKTSDQFRRSNWFISGLRCARAFRRAENYYTVDALRDGMFRDIGGSELALCDKVEMLQLADDYTSIYSLPLCASCEDRAADVRGFHDLWSVCTGSCPCVRGSAEDAAGEVVLKEAPVPNQLERTEFSPRVDLRRDERTEFSLTEDGGAVASGVSGPPMGVVAANRDTLKEVDDDDDADDDRGGVQGDSAKEAALEPLAAAACPEVDSKEAAFRLLIFELEVWCGYDSLAAVSARDQVAGESDSVKEAPVPSVDRLERTEFSPRVEQEQEREQGYEQKQEQERVCEQSIGMASDSAVDRLEAISSVGDASREAVVVLKIGWCPDMGGRAVVSVRKAVGAGFGYLAEGMPVIRADTAGLVQEATLRVADVHVPVKEAPVVVVDAALSMVVKISERCEAVPACMESMGLLIEVIQMVLSPAVSGAVVDRYILALAVLASMAVEVVVPGSDPPLLSDLVGSGCDPPMQSCC